MVFPAVAAILIGGANINKGEAWSNVLVGTFLFQGFADNDPVGHQLGPPDRHVGGHQDDRPRTA